MSAPHDMARAPAALPIVVVTRPAGQAGALSAALAQAGFASFEFPLLEIAPSPDPQPVRHAFAALDQYALVLFVSPNAIEHALAQLTLDWPAHVPIGVLGPGSVRALAQRGIGAPRVHVIAPRGALAAAADAADAADAAAAANQSGAPALEDVARPGVQPSDHAGDHQADADQHEAVRYDSEALLDALDQALSLDSLIGKRVLLVKGDGGRELLAQTLQAMGVTVDAVNAYRRSAPEPTPQQWQALRDLLAAPQRVAAWVLTSSEGVRHLDSLARRHLDAAQLAALRHSPVLAPHPRIAEAARSLGFDTVTVSGAGDRNIVSALLSQAAQPNLMRMTDTHDMHTDSNADSRPLAAATPAAGGAYVPPRTPGAGAPLAAPPRAPSGVAQRAPLWIGLIVVLAAGGAGGYLLNHKLQRSQLVLTQRLDASDARLSATLAQTQQALAAARDLNAQLGQFNTKLQDAQAGQQALQQQYQDFTRNRDDWTLAEIGQILSTASEQLQLTGNVQLALFALQSADTRLATSSAAQMITVRRAVQHDIEKLKATPQVDITGLAIKLDDAIAQIDTMPLLGEAKSTHKPGEANNTSASAVAAASSASAGSPWRNWLSQLGDDFGHSLRGLVQVRRIDNPDAMLVAPDQGYYLRANLKLRLLSARLSLLARNPATLKSDLEAASAAVKRYGDPASQQVQTVQGLLQQVDQAAATVQVPDMSGSLNAVRQFKSRG
jgi:uroporphyrinogen III methyltransferase/synthase